MLSSNIGKVSTAAVALRSAICAVALTGCELAHNYVDPDSPRYAGDYAEPTPRAAETLLVVTYNLAYALEIDRAIAVLRAPPLADADIVLMQEMDGEGCERIASALGLRYVYYPASIARGRDFGTAVLTRHPITADHKLILPHAEPLNGRRRNATAARLIIGGRPVMVWSVHSSVITLGLGARLDQVQTVIDDTAKSDGQVIVGGDFNTADPDAATQTVELFEANELMWASEGVGDTGRGAGLTFLLDFLFTSGLTVLEAGVVRGDSGSDHQPVWMRVSAPTTIP